jgi:hypothetical protein
MTDVMRSPATRDPARRQTADPAATPLRPLALGAALAGALASGAVLMGCMALGLVGWFASDAGAHGDTRDAIRVGADGWLLAHGSQLHLVSGATPVTITAVPLGLTLLCGYVTYRLGSWAALTSAVEEARGVALGAVVLAGLYAVVALVTAVLAATVGAEPGLLRSFVGAFGLAFATGGAGLVQGTRAAGGVLPWSERLPETVRAVLRGAVAAALLLCAGAAALLASALLLDLGTAATVLSRLHTDTPGGLLYAVLVALVAPNAVLLTGSYLLGPGFAVGAGTVVSPSAVVLGPVPAFPLLAALPAEGTPPGWCTALMAAPVLAGLVAAVLVVRRHAVSGLEVGAGRGLGAGLLGGLLLSAAIALAGGSLGPGRMTDVGADWWPTLLAATVAMGVGGVVGGVLAAWWGRRRGSQ